MACASCRRLFSLIAFGLAVRTRSGNLNARTCGILTCHFAEQVWLNTAEAGSAQAVEVLRNGFVSRDEYDLSRFLFTGRLPVLALAQLFAITDLHIYLTVPFVLSWSLMNALACGTTVLAPKEA